MRQDVVRPGALGALWRFGVMQANAALFGLLFLGGMLLSSAAWSPDWPVHRYDALFVWALLIQGGLLLSGAERWDEAKVILVFHVTGTVMELFKTAAGSWAYPEAALFRIEGVPLFTGFMYAAVGSYIARAARLYEMRFAPYPPFWASVALAVAIYVNFFAHHYVWDARWVLVALTVLLYGRTLVWARLGGWVRVPFVLAALVAALGVYAAENVGTLSGTWIYAGQARWEPVNLSKLVSWYLLIFVAFATVTLVSREALVRGEWRPT